MSYARRMGIRTLSVVENRVPRYTPSKFNAAADVISEVIEECAKMIDCACLDVGCVAKKNAARIRTLKDQP